MSRFYHFDFDRTSCRRLVLVSSLFLLLPFGMVRGQDSALYLAYYEMRHVIDKEKPSDTLTDVMLLLIGKNSTQFTSYNKLVYGYQLEQAIKEEIEKSKYAADPFVLKRKAGRFVLDEIYMFHQDGRCFELTYLLDRYLSEDNYQVLDWKILPDKKSILGLSCQQATASFRGRDWSVWFSSDVPINGGPWLLHGLPGLIIEAEDRTGEVIFSLVNLESDLGKVIQSDRVLDAYIDEMIELPIDINVKRISKEEITKLKDQVQRNLQGYIEMRMKANGFMDNPFSGGGAWMTPIPNPIALDNY